MDRHTLIQGVRINSCGLSDCPPSWSWDTGAAGFPDFDLWTVLRGKGSLRDTQKRYEVSEGCCFLLGPGIRYVGSHSPQNPLLVINVHFSFQADASACLMDPGATVFRRISNLPFFIDLLNRILISYNRGSRETAQLWLEAALLEFWGQTREDAALRHGSWNRIVEEICSMVHLRFANPPTLDELARKYGYSPDYLSRMFKAVMNMNFSQYVINSRLSQARLLLQTTQLSVEEIAEQLGYYDACHFVKQFKKHVGQTPHSYKKSG